MASLGDEKRSRAVSAAAELFLSHGFARTTMGDIARAAGMSRPALYLLFPGKEELFEATVLHLNELRFGEIRSALAATQGLAARLFLVCDLWLVRVFELKQTRPEARDMDDLSIPVVGRVYAELEASIAGLIHEAGGGFTGATTQELARNLVFAVRGLGAAASTVEEMRSMTRLQVDLACAAIEGARLPA